MKKVSLCKRMLILVIAVAMVATSLMVISPSTVFAAGGYASFDNPASRGESVKTVREKYTMHLELSWVVQGETAIERAEMSGYMLPSIPSSEELYVFNVAYLLESSTLNGYRVSNKDFSTYTAPGKKYSSQTLIGVTEMDYNHTLTPDKGWVRELHAIVAPKGSNPYVVYKSPVDGNEMVWQFRNDHSPLTVDSVSTDISEESYIVGSPITATVHVSGGANRWPSQLHYQYLLIKGHTAFKTKQGFDNTLSFIVPEPGTYELQIEVSNGDELVYFGHTMEFRNPDPFKTAVFRAGNSSSYLTGETINMAARGEGGVPPYKYSFYVKRSDGRKVNFRSRPTNSNIYAWTPLTADSYIAGVDIYDYAGNHTFKELPVTVSAPAPLSVAVFRAGNSSTYKIGDVINLAARGEGGKAPYKYQFYAIRPNGSRVNFRSTPVSSNIYPWTPVTPGSYRIGVDVYDASGKKATKETQVQISSAEPMSIAVFRAGSSSSYKVGDTINLAARGKGGVAPYRYQFFAIRSNGTRVNFRSSPVYSNIYPWTPWTPDSYLIGVDVYDATGKMLRATIPVSVSSTSSQQTAPASKTDKEDSFIAEPLEELNPEEIPENPEDVSLIGEELTEHETNESHESLEIVDTPVEVAETDTSEVDTVAEKETEATD